MLYPNSMELSVLISPNQLPHLNIAICKLFYIIELYQKYFLFSINFVNKDNKRDIGKHATLHLHIISAFLHITCFFYN